MPQSKCVFTVYHLCQRRPTPERLTYANKWDGLEVLYVGYSSNIGRRLAEHSFDKPWWPKVTDIMLQNFTTYEAAVVFEEAEIKKWTPVYNHLGVKAPYIRPDPPADVYAALERRIWSLELKMDDPL